MTAPSGKSGKSGKRCATCHTVAPGTETDYTLISHKHGWRVVKVTGAHGKPALEWYCPQCWRARSARASG